MEELANMKKKYGDKEPSRPVAKKIATDLDATAEDVLSWWALV